MTPEELDILVKDLGQLAQVIMDFADKLEALSTALREREED